MPQLIDKKKLYLYFVFIFFLLIFDNLNLIYSISNFFKIKKIIITNKITQDIKNEISFTLNKFYNLNIFSLKPDAIKSELNKFNIIDNYEIKKEYPSKIKIEITETNILAYYFDNNSKVFLGKNGKKIKKNIINGENLPLIIGNFETKNFLDLKEKLNINGFKLNEINKFYFYNSNRWDLEFKSGILVKLPIDEFEKSLSLLKDILKISKLNDIKIIDLRIKKKIILS